MKVKIFLVFLILVFSLGAVSAHDNSGDLSIDEGSDELCDGEVEKTFDDIQTAIDNAQVNDTINLEGHYAASEESVSVSKSITLDGQGKTTIDAGGSDKIIFDALRANVLFKNLKFINSNAAVINSLYCNVTVDNCEFINNNGPSVNSWGDNLTVENSFFKNSGDSRAILSTLAGTANVSNNTFEGTGGIKLSGNNINILNNNFRNNKAKYGGAIGIGDEMNFNQGKGLIEGNIFENNTATDQFGGAIFLNSDDIIIRDCTFTKNSASIGGAVYSCEKNISIANVCLENNHAEKGIIYFGGKDGKIIDSAFSYNDAEYGSGIYIGCDNAVVDNCIFKNNYASYGGAVYYGSQGGLINNSIFENNDGYWYSAVIAEGNGLCLINSNFTKNDKIVFYIHGDNCTVDNINFIDNRVEYGLYIAADNVSVKNSNFINNKVEDCLIYELGRNINNTNCNYISTAGSVINKCWGIMDNCSFINTISDKSIVFWNPLGFQYDFDVNRHAIRNSLFLNNTIKNDGSPLWVGCTNASLISCKFIDNTATKGGAVYWNDATDYHYGYIENCSFIRNSADIGGALYLCNSNIEFKGNEFTGNNALSYKDVYGYFSYDFSNTALYYGEKITVEIKDMYSKTKVDGLSVRFCVNDAKNRKTLKDVDSISKKGLATFDTLSLKNTGSYIVYFIPGPDTDLDFELTGKFTVKKAPTSVKAPKVTNKYKKSQYFRVSVKNRETKEPVKSTSIKLKIDKKTYNVQTNSKGVAKFNTKKLKVGKHKVTISSGSDNYDISAKSSIRIRR